MELAKQKNYQQAFDLGCAAIKGMDLAEKAEKAGVIYEKGREGEKIIVHFFSEPYQISFPQVEFFCSSKKTVSLVARVLILHYLLRADGSPLTGRWIGYKEIPGALLYASVFARRVTEPLIRKFGNSSKLFKNVCETLGGQPVKVGDASFILQAFPSIQLQYVLWEGDEEFTPTVQLLFDASVDHYLSLEDIVVLGQMASSRLIQRVQAIV